MSEEAQWTQLDRFFQKHFNTALRQPGAFLDSFPVDEREEKLTMEQLGKLRDSVIKLMPYTCHDIAVIIESAEYNIQKKTSIYTEIFMNALQAFLNQLCCLNHKCAILAKVDSNSIPMMFNSIPIPISLQKILILFDLNYYSNSFL